jgi:hypothetical protein
MTQVLEGLSENEVVVTSSQFLIDSESKLREATAKLMDSSKTRESTSTQDDPSMDMSGMTMESEGVNDMDMSDMTMDKL